MSRTFFISDTHFHHKNVLKYEPIRIKKLVQYYQSSGKFGTLSADDIEKRIYEMMTTDEGYNEVICDHDKMLIKEWNSVVKPSDTVWFLGDFSLHDREYTRTIISKLNGHKRMIKGNHDNWSNSFYQEAGFEYISQYPIILKRHFILSHTPMPTPTNDDYYYIYGHVHSNPSIFKSLPNASCVCVECTDFKPIRIKEFDMAQ